MEKRYERIYEDFKKEKPRLAEQVVDYLPRGRHSLTLRMRDGLTMVYNPVIHDVYLDNPEAAIELSILRSTDSFGARLTSLMKDRGYTNEYLSRLTGITVATLNNYRNGWSNPSWYNARKLSIALGCELDEFM